LVSPPLGKADERYKVVQTAVAAIRALPFEVAVRVCGFPASSLLPIDLDLSEIGDPMLIIYESIERMFSALADYDYFLNIEDDVLVSKEMFENCIYFNSVSNLDEVYLPNRMERGNDGSLRQATCFLEYGTGEATVQAVALAIPTVLIVESDLLRLEVLRYKLETTASSTNCHLRHVDIGWRSNSHDRASDAYWRTY
jgi:hypothetical protein